MRRQNQLDVNSEALTSEEVAKLKDVYEQIQGQGETEKQEDTDHVEFVPEDVSAKDALKEIVEETVGEKATDEVSSTVSGVSDKLEKAGIDVQEASASDVLFNQTFSLCQQYFIDESFEIPAVREINTGELVEGEIKNQVLFMNALVAEIAKDKKLNELSQEENDMLKAKFLQIVNLPNSAEVIARTIQNYIEYVQSMDMSRERKPETSSDNNE